MLSAANQIIRPKAMHKLVPSFSREPSSAKYKSKVMKPIFPVILVGDKFYADIITKEEELSKTVASALIDLSSYAGDIFYDSNFETWTHVQTSDKFKHNFLTIYLAKKMIYNPVIDVKIAWTKKGTYELDELKKLLQKCIDEDDEFITQFEGANDLKEKIKQSSTFQQLIEALKAYIDF